jgi:hypothetical protein
MQRGELLSLNYKTEIKNHNFLSQKEELLTLNEGA